MCGIVGYIGKDKVNKDILRKMLLKIKHRGPDNQNLKIIGKVGFGHALLKIQDMSDGSQQPFIFKDLMLTYNGEIYNYRELREELKKLNYEFSTDGDTEVLIKYIDCFGLDETLKKIEGCFAFALYNKNTNECFLVRDRAGMKPLYYYKDNDKFVFASEIKAILECDVPRCLNLETLLIDFNCRLWTHPEKTLFKDIYLLKPGTYLRISANGIEKREYYNLKFTNEYINPEKLVEDFGEEFESSVNKKLISKVPVAAFLSGGLDSSIVCKILAEKSKNQLNTYTVHYNFDNDLDLNHADILSGNLSIKSKHVLISENMYNLENIDKVTYAVEEIMIDKVYIPTYFNYKAAKDDNFRVVVTGQGADEIWLGYIFTWKIFQFLGNKANKKTLINDYYKKNMIFSKKMRSNIKKQVDNIMENYLDELLDLNKKDVVNSYGDLSRKTILQDLLMQEDKLAMAHSIESRAPFIDDHKIMELGYKANSKVKIYDGREKYIVREYARGNISDKIVNREKYPFPEPPVVYNKKIYELCKDNWDELSHSKIINLIIDDKYLNNVDNFSALEQWWLLICWRFEKVFNIDI